MPPRSTKSGRASVPYAEEGAVPSAVQHYCHVTLKLPVEESVLRREAILEELRAWRVQHLAAWKAGENVPEPPYADGLDCWGH
jgi:hypothetical protein